MAEELVEIECKLVWWTDKAFMLATEEFGGEGVWVPRFVVEWHPKTPGVGIESGQIGTAVMPQSWAESKGFV